MTSKEKNYKKIMIITIITSIIVVLGTVSYAFYQTAINGRVLGTMAEWSFTANDHVDSLDLYLGELYPGRSGTYNITLSAANSDLDVYYELIFTSADINQLMYWDSGYTKPLLGYDSNSYVGKYGVITKGSSITIPIYLYWPYDNPYNEDGVDNYVNVNDIYMSAIKIVAKQYTGYSGTIPMNLLGFTNLVSYNEIGNGLVIPVKGAPCNEHIDSYGYPYYSASDCTYNSYLNIYKYKFETINATNGYVIFVNNR